MRIFKTITIIAVLVPIVLTLAGCKGGDATTKPDAKPTTTKPTVEKPLTDLGILANHFATKKYTGDTKQYTIDDIIAPQKIISALTNTKISYIKLLRNEILARRGYVFKAEKQKLHGLKLEVIKEILQPAKWYSGNPDFIYADLTKIEIANVSFLKRLEKIEAKRGNFARQLALVVGKDKHDINTDEAMMIFKITKDADVLTSLNSTADKLFKQLIKYKGWNAGQGIYELQFSPGKNKFLQMYESVNSLGFPGPSIQDAVSSSQSNELYAYGGFVLSLKEGDRIYLKGHSVGTKKIVHYVAEVYMDFPITESGTAKSVPNWDVSFDRRNATPESSSIYETISPYKDNKFFMGIGTNAKEINTKTKKVEKIIFSTEFIKIFDTHIIKYMDEENGYQRILKNIPWDIYIFSEVGIENSDATLFKVVQFDDSEFYFSVAYRPDVRNIYYEGVSRPKRYDIEARPYKAEWTNDNSLFKGVRIYRYIKVK